MCILYIYIYICNSRLLLLFNSETRKQKQQNSGKTQKTSLSSKPSVLPKVLLLFCFSSKMLGLELKTVVFWCALIFFVAPWKTKKREFCFNDQSINQSIQTQGVCVFFPHLGLVFWFLKSQKPWKTCCLFCLRYWLIICMQRNKTQGSCLYPF